MLKRLVIRNAEAMRLFLKQFVKTINEQSENNIYRSSHRRCSIKNVLLKMSQNSKSFFFLAILLQKRLRYKCFFCDFCEIFKNNYFEGHLRTAASVFNKTTL